MEPVFQGLAAASFILGPISLAVSIIAFLQNAPRAAFRRRKFEVIRALGWTALLIWMQADGTSDEDEVDAIAPNIGALREYFARLKGYLAAATELGIVADIAKYKAKRVVNFAVFEMLLSEVLKIQDDKDFHNRIFVPAFYEGLLDLCQYCVDVKVFPRDVKLHFLRTIESMRQNIQKKFGKDAAKDIPRPSKRKYDSDRRDRQYR